MGESGFWRGRVAAAALGATVYTIESSGRLYATDLATGQWQQLGEPSFAGTSRVFAAAASLVTLERSGSLYAVGV